MQTSEILAAVDHEIRVLQQVKNLLSDGEIVRRRRSPHAVAPATAFPFGVGGSQAPKRRHKISAAGRARIVAAQKARWAKLKKAKGEKK